ncbi:MAG: class I adenylate-forming enzyme family protein [Candidatus Dormibacteria bacterium]
MPIQPDPETIAGLFMNAARDAGDAPHLVLPDGGTSTYSQTLERARRLAGVLASGGVGPGTRVVAVMHNCRALVELYIATAILGAVSVPVNGSNTSRENEAVLVDCEPLAVVADAAHLSSLEGRGLPSARLLSDGTSPGWSSYEAETAAGAPWEGPSSVSGDDPAMIVYSSGTTGRPKGIVLGHRALLVNARMTLHRLRFRSSDVFLTLLPLYSSFGHSFDFLQAALARGRTVVEPSFDPGRALRLIERHRVTCIAGVTTMFVRMFGASATAGPDVSSLRLLDVGGGPVPDSLKVQLRERANVAVVESYGLTEISPVACVEDPAHLSPTGSCGRPLDGITVRVASPDGEGVRAGESGELLFRSPTLMLEYWRQREATAEALRDGWLHSGDFGRVDADGNVYIIDRIKDLIVTSGNNVFPKEVENVIYEHPAVESAAVVGLPDPVRGEVVHAFVVLRHGRTASADELIAHCRQSLARFKVPRTITFVDALPLTGSGKIRRVQLRESMASPGGAE